MALSINLIKIGLIWSLLSLGPFTAAGALAEPNSATSSKVGLMGSGVKKLEWLDGYSGQSVDQLLSLEGKYRIDSLVLAFEQAIGQKVARVGERGLSNEERIVLAVEGLEREVNNGGYAQFFTNSSREYASIIVNSLQRIGCRKAANITEKAIKALDISDLTVEAIETVMAKNDKQREAKLNQCDDEYYKNEEPIADQLFEFIKANKAHIRL